MPKTIYSEEHERLVQILRDHRARKRVTQAELAERLNRPQSYVSKVESGQRRLDLIELKAWCDALRIDVVRVVRAWSTPKA